MLLIFVVEVVDRLLLSCFGTYIVSCSQRTQKIVSNKRRTGDGSDEYYVPSHRCCGEANQDPSGYRQATCLEHEANQGLGS